jgi:hypothetical protein
MPSFAAPLIDEAALCNPNQCGDGPFGSITPKLFGFAAILFLLCFLSKVFDQKRKVKNVILHFKSSVMETVEEMMT